MTNKIGFVSLFAVSSMLLCSCRFTAPSAEEEKGVLEEAGYSVIVLDDYDDEQHPVLQFCTGVNECLYGKKDKDEIYLIYFLSTQTAEDNYDFIYTNLKKGQINELVYVGTSQAIKDAKL